VSSAHAHKIALVMLSELKACIHYPLVKWKNDIKTRNLTVPSKPSAMYLARGNRRKPKKLENKPLTHPLQSSDAQTGGNYERE